MRDHAQSYHVKNTLLCLVIYVVEEGVLVPHVAVKVELLELSKSAEAEQTEDLLAEVVAEVSVAPNLLERAAVFCPRGRGHVSLHAFLRIA